MRTIYWHVGYNKTGTTSIQNYLNLNYDSLAESGVLYPKCLRITKSNKAKFAHHDLAYLFGFSSKPTKLKITSQNRLHNALKNECDEKNCNEVIISSEAFINFKNRKPLIEFKRAFRSFKIKPIIYLRRQDKFCESLYKELIKNGLTYFDQASEFMLVPNYFNKAELFSKVFGKENVILKIFDNPANKSNLVDSFLQNLGRTTAEFALLKTGIYRNISFSNETTILISNLNQISNGEYKKQIFEFFKNYYQEREIQEEETKLLTAKQLSQIHLKSKESNKKLKENYFDKDEQFLLEWDLKEQLKTYQVFNGQKIDEQFLHYLLSAITQNTKSNT